MIHWVLFSALIAHTIHETEGANSEEWVMGDAGTTCSAACSAYNPAYTCTARELTQQATMTPQICGNLWTTTTAGYDPVKHLREAPYPVWPAASLEGWNVGSAAPCVFQFNSGKGELVYLGNKDGYEPHDKPPEPLSCDRTAHNYYPLCYCDTGVPVDPCLNVDCSGNDDNLCTDDTCNAISGLCQSIAKVCDANSDLCLIDSCDEATGQCTPAPKCAANLVCVAGECKRDCNAFQIDDFLRDCSDEFKTNEGDIATLQTEVGALETQVTTITGQILPGIENSITTANNNIVSNDGDISAIEGRLDINEPKITDLTGRVTTAEGGIDDLKDADITTEDTIIALTTRVSAVETSLNEGGTIEDRLDIIEGEIDSNDGEIADLTNRVGVVETSLNAGGTISNRLDALETETAADGDIHTQLNTLQSELNKFSAHSQGLNVIDNDAMQNTSWFISNQSKDMLLIFLLILNTLLIVSGAISCVLWNKSRGKYHQYNNTKVYSSDDENRQLQM